MGFKFNKLLPTPDEIREQFPLPAHLAELKAQRDKEIADIIEGKSDKFLIIIGPCSADNEEAVCDYTSRLVKVQEKTKDRLIIIPRVYTNKPRTTGEGYMGMIHQPDPEKKPDMFEGILAIRHMHMRVMRETGFSTADEMLYPENMRYLSDLMSYVAVGARPGKAKVTQVTDDGNESLADLAREAADAFNYGSNNRGSGEYRHQLARVYVRRLMERLTGRSVSKA